MRSGIGFRPTVGDAITRAAAEFGDTADRGQIVAAVVVPIDPDGWDAAAMTARARSALSSYKVPRRWILTEESRIPFLPNGKPDCRRLADLVRTGALDASPSA